MEKQTWNKSPAKRTTGRVLVALEWSSQ